MYSPKRYPPAGARDQSSLPCSCWDFPRICGEKDFYDLAIGNVPGPPPHTWGRGPGSPGARSPSRGSPPHTRGKVWRHMRICLPPRITPAYAGKSRPASGRLPSPGDHPRIRGEKLQLVSMPMRALGSPPHTRGKDRPAAILVVEAGITPAYAGKSKPGAFSGRAVWDHPRIRGEKDAAYAALFEAMGSPPHTRGKAHNQHP